MLYVYFIDAQEAALFLVLFNILTKVTDLEEIKFDVFTLKLYAISRIRLCLDKNLGSHSQGVGPTL